jgi:hypothetical protein
MYKNYFTTFELFFEFHIPASQKNTGVTSDTSPLFYELLLTHILIKKNTIKNNLLINNNILKVE